MSLCNPSKFCISLEQARKVFLLTFSTQTVAASCFSPTTVCWAVTKTCGDVISFDWDNKKMYCIVNKWMLSSCFVFLTVKLISFKEQIFSPSYEENRAVQWNLLFSKLILNQALHANSEVASYKIYSPTLL